MVRSIFSSVLALVLVGCGQTDFVTYSPTTILAKYGYSIHVPPSSLHGPGNLVWKRQAASSSENQLILGDICSPKFIAFPDSLSRSSAESLDFSKNRDFKFTANGLKKLGLQLSATYLSSVNISFKNTEVQEYSLEDLRSIRNSLGPVCSDLLERQRAKGNAYQVVGAFKADLEYKLTYKRAASAGIARLIQKELAAEFGIDFEGQQRQVGKGLFYGLYLDTL
ncbi:hypothetical protein [Sinorhizobium medicae]|uniref:Lipoprotein n=1 Tax=Sinorhizobium medicae (strain WSM419) TaxID=366394 RepID=A6UMP5_SINMW|nr:hypothetical protein [Sinorhizobium medicae]ABR64925.1 hypothetical protein Smed_6330 [Sinorhizobium medicae WSM419]